MRGAVGRWSERKINFWVGHYTGDAAGMQGNCWPGLGADWGMGCGFGNGGQPGCRAVSAGAGGWESSDGV